MKFKSVKFQITATWRSKLFNICLLPRSYCNFAFIVFFFFFDKILYSLLLLYNLVTRMLSCEGRINQLCNIYLFIWEIHQKPIREYHVHWFIRNFQVWARDVSTHEFDILIVPIHAFILLRIFWKKKFRQAPRTNKKYANITQTG